MAAYMNFSARTQVLSSPAGVPKREPCPKTWAASGAHAGEKAEGESKAQVSLEKA